MKISSLLAPAAIAVGMLLTMSIRNAAGEAGDLFPDVAPYDQTVTSPIKDPKNDVNPKPQQASPANPSTPDHAKPTPESQPPASPAAAALELLPYSQSLMQPLLSPEDEKTFSATYDGPIAKALPGKVEERRIAAGILEDAAEKTESLDLKRYLLLHAFGLYVRAATPLDQREKKANLILPLLTDRTLPVYQARADAIDDLLSTTSGTLNQHFVDLCLDAHATLAKFQVQAGFPKDAQLSLKKARDIASYYAKKPPMRMDELSEAGAWCERANAAAILWPKLQATLKSTPDDVFANTQMAILHLSLFGNLEHAAPFAAKSNRKDLKALAELLKPQSSAVDNPAGGAAHFVAVIAALVEIAKPANTSQSFDRYSIACYAGDHLAQALDTLPAEQTFKARLLLATAKDIVDRTGIKRGPDLPDWLAPAKTAAADPADPPKPAGPAKPQPIFLGDWNVSTNSGWHGTMKINADGTVTTDTNEIRHWTISDNQLVITGNATDTFDHITKDKMTGTNSHNRTTLAVRADSHEK